MTDKELYEILKEYAEATKGDMAIDLKKLREKQRKEKILEKKQKESK